MLGGQALDAEVIEFMRSRISQHEEFQEFEMDEQVAIMTLCDAAVIYYLEGSLRKVNTAPGSGNFH